MKKCISLILAFVFVIGVCASAPITITASAASETTNLTNTGEYELAVGEYTFTPATTGYYTFESSSNYDPCIEIQVSDGMYSSDDFGDGLDFKLCVYIEANSSAVFILEDYEDAETVPFTITYEGTEKPEWADDDYTVIRENGFSVKVTSTDNCEITDYDDSNLSDGALVIPQTISGYKVTSIGRDAFSDCTSLTSITIPNSVTSIGDYAFSDCSSLTSITIPNSVTSISYAAFWDCSSLTSITIPDSVTSIGHFAFYDCSSLTSITIPNGVTSIGNGTFVGCSSLTSITIPNGVTSIGDRTFVGCSSLTSITIPEGVTTIGVGAFSDCSSLTSITIPDSVTSIGNYAFDGTGYYNNSSNWENGVLYIGNRLIDVKAGLTACAIKNGVKYIPEEAFYGSDALTDVTIPDSVVSIGARAFYGCSSLKSIRIPSSVTEIGVLSLGYTKYTEWYEIEKDPNFIIYGTKNSVAEEYAKENGLVFKEDVPKLTLATPTVTQKNTAKGIQVNWNKIDGAESYVVYRSVYSGGKWSKWASIKKGVTGTSYVDGTVKLGTSYKYTVRAVNGSVMSGYQNTKDGLKYNVNPTVKVALASNGIKVSWSTAANATGYTVYSSTYNTKTKKWSGWTNRGTVKANKTSWTDKSVKSGTQYKYTVRAVNGKVLSSYNKTGAATLYLAQPTVKIANNAKGVKVAWSKVTGATGYTVYRSEYKNGAWTKWASRGTAKANKTSWTDTKVTSGVQYKYTVRAINGKYKSTYVSSNTVLYLAQPKATVKAVSNGINVAWTQSTGATGYTVYRMEYNAKTKKWSSWKKMGTAKASKTNWTDKSAKKGVQYKYTVKAVNGKTASTYKASSSVKR